MRRGVTGVAMLMGIACGRDDSVRAAIQADNESVQTWALETMWSAGGADAEGPEAFGSIQFLAEDAWGRVYALERRAQQVLLFDTTGRWVRTIGRRGPGPGELQRAFGLGVAPDGRLWVVDPTNLHYTVFDSTGQLVASIRRELIPFGARWEGRWVGTVLWDHASLEDRPGGRWGYMRWDSTAAPPYRDTILIPDTAQATHVVDNVQGNNRTRMIFPIPFAAEPLHAIAPDGTIWWAMSDRYEIVRLNAAGDTLATIRRPWTSTPVTAAERDEWVARLDRPGGERPDASLFPEHKPALERFAVDDDGNLWVLPLGMDGRFDVFAPDGRYLAVVQTPIETWGLGRPVMIGRNHVTWTTTDSLDAAIVQRARIVRP